MLPNGWEFIILIVLAVFLRIAAIGVAVTSLLGAVLGGLAGMRFHRNVDKAGLGD